MTGVSEVQAIPKPAPVVDDLTRPFFAAAAEGRLVVQRCGTCGHLQLPAARYCGACRGRDLDWIDVSGRGQVHTYTVLHRAYHPAFADEVPYNVSIVQLDEGPFILTNVVGQPLEDLTIGQRVRVVFEPVEEGVALPKFEPDARGA